MAVLKTNYKDDVLNTSVNTNRVFDLVDENGNLIQANVSLVEKTVLSVEGDDFGARDINETNNEVNQINNDLSAIIKIKSITPISTNGGADSSWKDITYNFPTAYEDASKLMFVASGVGTYNGANGVYFIQSSLTTTKIVFATYNVSTIKGFVIELY